MENKGGAAAAGGNDNAEQASHASGLQSSAYSMVSEGAKRRAAAAQSLKEQNIALREAQQLIQKTKYIDCEFSPLAKNPVNYETRLPNQDRNYGLSPAAKRARQDGSLDPSQTFFNRTINRKLKMRDTFTKIFPSYNHGAPTCYQPSQTHASHFYPKKDDVGKRMVDIDRSFTHKKDFMKEYTESMLKIQNMRRHV